jgi:signal transduction histidine kinase
MSQPSLLGSSTFRLALLYLALFAGSVLLLLAFIYWSTISFMTEQVDTTIETEIVGLSEQYREGRLNALVRTIEDRVERNPTGSSLYLFTTGSGRPLAGNLSGWPASDADPNGWLDFEVTSEGGKGTTLRARARVFQLAGDFRLLVGRDIRELEASQALIEQALWWGLAITVGLGLLGGFMLSRGVLSRIEQINQTSRDIMSGDLSRRVPTSGSSEFDELATNLNAMLDEIERLLAGIKQVSDNIAHDLRTPLTRLRTRLETLRSTRPDDSTTDANHLVPLERCISDADQLLNTFNALLRISRLESGGHELATQPVDIRQLLADAVELYQAYAEEKQVQIQVQADQLSSMSVAGDRDLLFQAVCNLLDNAVKFTPTGGCIEWSATAGSDTVVLQITDSGPGVTLAERDKITQRFYRGEHSRSTSGNGLGLSLVAAIVRAHDGLLSFSDVETGFCAAIQLPSGPPTDQPSAQ